MSIPPLVCSTPPPPDQCEDDKDPEDYDLQYNLSQEDDEGIDYDFGNFSSYSSHYESHTPEKQVEVINKEEKIEKSETTSSESETSVENYTNETMIGTNNKSNETLKYDEDINIEDLNLQVDNEPTDTNLKDINIEDKSSTMEADNYSLKENSVEISNVVNSIDSDDNVCLPTNPFKENVTELAEDTITKSDLFVDEAVETHLAKIVSDDFDCPPKSLEIATDNFGDFDDFQFIRSDSKPTDVVETCDNPWDNKVIDSSDFGDFTANFEDNGIGICNKSDDQPYACSDEGDYGDFDDFKSSVIHTPTIITQESETAHSVHVLNIQSSDDEPIVMENINKLLSSIFEEEITETENDIEVKLESFLSETWGYLIETDIRQPYIINWNNSLGQKTLLRALCIDSRNILFGHKWGHNMPKYVANLRAAPLQPQKQFTTSDVILKNGVVNVEKSVIKSETWTDPFTADGQESCNTEGESSIDDPRPTDLDVFEATMTSKSEKIYPSSIDIQPIRQINLPETHIFTPTDSETPRSKTTHYNCGPPILIPQQVSGSQVIQTENNSSEHVNEEKKTEEDEDWEFQGFNSNPNANSLTPTTNCQTVASIDKCHESPSLPTPLPIQSSAYQTQVLQPIKIEPDMPTLNWPDPGEVKHVFDDFTDFVSNSSWIEKSSTIIQTDSSKPVYTKDQVTDSGIEQEKIDKGALVGTTNDNSGFDDDFDTFQSALPSRKQLHAFKSVNISNTDTSNLSPQITNHVKSTSISDIQNVFQKVNNVKSEPISFTNVSTLNESFTTNLTFMSNASDFTSVNNVSTGLPLQSKILQPTPAITSISLVPYQPKSGQILQPLSLESYSQINWPSPGIDLQDLSRFNPVDTLHSLKSDLSTGGQIKNSPIHNKTITNNQVLDDDVWGEFVSSKPKPHPAQTKKNQVSNDDDEWTDFVSSSSIKPQNGLNTISLNVHTNSNMQKTANQSKFNIKNEQMSLDIPTLNYITPRTNTHKTYNDRHFQNL